MNVAIVGGSRFDAEKLEEFIFKLAEKHPDAVIFTGDGGKGGSEKTVLSLAEAIGLTVIQPKLHPEWFGDEALISQVNDILVQSGDSPIVLIGTGARVSRVKDILKRLAPYRETPRLVHEIAKVPTPEREPAPRKAKKSVFTDNAA